MSSCTRVVRNKALSGHAIPSREGHEGVPLIFDACVLGDWGLQPNCPR